MFRFGDPGGRIYGSVGTSNANLLAWWTSLSLNNNGTIAVSAGNGRTSGSSLRFGSNGNSGNTVTLSKTLDPQATWGQAFGWRPSSLPGNSYAISEVLDVATAQCDLRVNTDGTLSITRSGTVLGTTSTSFVTPNVYIHLEWKVTIHSSTGTAALWVNGVQQLNLTGLNTRTTGNNTANVVAIGIIIAPNGTAGNFDFDDVIIYDGQTTDANGFSDIVGPIGDCGLTWLLPTGVGTTTQFTPDTGNNYARVNEATPDGDTSYVESSTVGNIDTYAMADLGGTVATVKSIAAIHYAKKTDVGSRGMKAQLRSASANAAYATEISLSNSYQYYFSNFGQDPNNGSPINWTVSAVNALESGETVSS